MQTIKFSLGVYQVNTSLNQFHLELSRAAFRGEAHVRCFLYAHTLLSEIVRGATDPTTKTGAHISNPFKRLSLGQKKELPTVQIVTITQNARKKEAKI